MFGIPIFIVVLVGLFLLRGLRVIQQGTVGVVTTLGKFSNVIYPGLSIVIPIIQDVRRISTQNKSVEMDFQATKQTSILRRCSSFR